jgi:hypothetical protein
MAKHHQISAVVSAMMLSLMASPEARAKQTVEVAFALDTTGSMGPLIESAERRPQHSTALGQQSSERKELNAERADLVAKRDIYIAAQPSKQQPMTSSFDQAIAATLKTQIK